MQPNAAKLGVSRSLNTMHGQRWNLARKITPYIHSRVSKFLPVWSQYMWLWDCMGVPIKIQNSIKFPVYCHGGDTNHRWWWNFLDKPTPLVHSCVLISQLSVVGCGNGISMEFRVWSNFRFLAPRKRHEAPINVKLLFHTKLFLEKCKNMGMDPGNR